MARPHKTGLDYFSLDVNFFSDRKIKILKARYGADGITIYLYILCEIYKNEGYYLKVDDDLEFIISDDLNMNCNEVKQVLNFLLERSLFDNTLFQSDKVLTSAGIQKRFQLMVKSRAVKNPIEITRFWLLNEKETETFIKVLPFLNKSRKNNSYSEKNNSKSRNNDIKESKEKESKENNINTNVAQPYFINNELNEAFMQYLSMRQKNGNKLEEGQIKILRQNLLDISDNDIDRIAAAKSAYTSEWKNFYPDNKKGKQTGKNNINKFNNFNQRQYDYEQLERQILTSQLKNGV